MTGIKNTTLNRKLVEDQVMKPRITVALLLFPALLLALPQSKKSLTNSDIISMVKQGVTDSVIVLAIEASETGFDISVDQRVRLYQAGVSGDIIKAMIAAEARKSSAKRPSSWQDTSSGPLPIFCPPPSYTEEARAARVEGVVVLEAVVRKDGRVDSIKVIKSVGYGLDQSAINTISTRWRFKPAMSRDGTPIDYSATFEITFRLH